MFQLPRRFPAINNVRQWKATLKMYQSNEVFLCCRHSYLRLFLFYVHKLIHFPSFLFLRHFYHQDAKYDMFLSPKINKFFTRLIFACLYFPVVEIWFIRVRKVLEEFEGEYDFWIKTNSSIFCQNSSKEKQNKLPLGMMKTLIALGTTLFEPTFESLIPCRDDRNISVISQIFYRNRNNPFTCTHDQIYSYSLYSVDTKSSSQMMRIFDTKFSLTITKKFIADEREILSHQSHLSGQRVNALKHSSESEFEPNYDWSEQFLPWSFLPDVLLCKFCWT